MPLSRFVAYFCSLMAVCVVAFPRTLSVSSPTEQFAPQISDDSRADDADGPANPAPDTAVPHFPPAPPTPNRRMRGLLLSGDYDLTRTRSCRWRFSLSDGGKAAKPEKGLDA